MLPKVHILGTGGSISGIGPHRLDYTLYPDVGKKLAVDELLARIPEARELAELGGEDLLQVGSPSIGPVQWLQLGERIHTLFNSSSANGVVVTDTLDPNAAYLHFTSNETIHGVEYFSEPTPPAGVPLICDTSSDFISRPLDISKYAMLYAGAQKNAGPAGTTVVIIRDDLIERTPANLPVMLDYKALAASGSLHNTPPAFAIYMVGLVFQWAKKLGGLAEIQKINRKKADAIYSAIDESGGFYRGHAQPEARSVMNIPFRLPSEELEDTFAKEAKSNDLIGLKGHRSVGGMRASIYNAMTVEGAEELVKFMKEFQKKNG